MFLPVVEDNTEYGIKSHLALKIFVTVINTPLNPHVFSIKKKKENFEYTQQILDSNKIEPPFIENHTHMQIIPLWAYSCLWLSFQFDMKFKSKLDIIFHLFKF